MGLKALPLELESLAVMPSPAADFFNEMAIMIPALCAWQSCSEDNMGNYFTYVTSVYDPQMSEPMTTPLLLTVPFWEVSR